MRSLLSLLLLVSSAALTQAGAQSRTNAPDGAAVSGELRRWHKVTLTLNGPESAETASPNPFTDYRLDVTFAHESGAPSYVVPGYFAGDGNAAASSATSGNKWRVHFAPDRAGRWTWRVSLKSGAGVALGETAGTAVAPFEGQTGTLQIAETNKSWPDFRARGRLRYVGQRYLQFAGSGEYFLKVGTDSPETLLAYADFDGTTLTKAQVPIKSYTDHVADWRNGDPTWKDGKGKGLIGAINYLSSKGVNALSFLAYNAGGDGDNVWPYVTRNDKQHFDVSKLDQWQIVFDHAQAKGLYLHFKLQETENDDNRRGNPYDPPGGRGGGRGRGPEPTGPVVESLDGGALGPERKLYLRELVARFGYLLALNWNLGEENTQSAVEQIAMAQYIKDVDPYDHHLVVHTYPNGTDAIYPQLIGDRSVLTGASLQIAPWNAVHERTHKWIQASVTAGKPWVIANDEQGPATLGVPPDPGYRGFNGQTPQGQAVANSHDNTRKFVLWGNLMAGGAGVEYYFGYQLAENDLVAEDFRSRDRSWDFGRIALTFFRDHKIPVVEMSNVDELVGNTAHDNSKWALAKRGELYLVYLPSGGITELDLSGVSGRFSVNWFDPETGGAFTRGAVTAVTGGGRVSLGEPPSRPTSDWLVVVRRN
jgi:hypothetical protein